MSETGITLAPGLENSDGLAVKTSHSNTISLQKFQKTRNDLLVSYGHIFTPDRFPFQGGKIAMVKLRKNNSPVGAFGGGFADVYMYSSTVSEKLLAVKFVRMQKPDDHFTVSISLFTVVEKQLTMALKI